MFKIVKYKQRSFYIPSHCIHAYLELVQSTEITAGVMVMKFTQHALVLATCATKFFCRERNNDTKRKERDDQCLLIENHLRNFSFNLKIRMKSFQLKHLKFHVLKYIFLKSQFFKDNMLFNKIHCWKLPTSDLHDSLIFEKTI